MPRPDYAKEIERAIENIPFGEMFLYSDFADIASNDAVRQVFSRMAAARKIRRVVNGVYDRPKYNATINEFVAPDPDKAAHAIARKFGWNIAPVGVTALNLLGLSTQVPNVFEYVSTGPYRGYQLGRYRIAYSRTASRELASLSPISALVVQAIKAIGKEAITSADIKQIAVRLSGEDKQRLINECRRVTVWVYEIIKRIAQPKSD